MRADSNHRSIAPKLKDMATWTGLIGHAQLRCFVDEEGRFWLEQNSSKQSKRGKLAREGYDIPVVARPKALDCGVVCSSTAKIARARQTI
jgi:hypothetical protein